MRTSIASKKYTSREARTVRDMFTSKNVETMF